MKNLSIIFILPILMALAVTSSSAETPAQFKIIVNAAQPDSSLSAKSISKVFLKKVKKWKSLDKPIIVVDLEHESRVRATFSKVILRTEVHTVLTYWQKQLLSGNRIPTQEMKNDTDVLEFVQENVGAIGYISKDTKIGDYKVKILKVAK